MEIPDVGTRTPDLRIMRPLPDSFNDCTTLSLGTPLPWAVARAVARGRKGVRIRPGHDDGFIIGGLGLEGREHRRGGLDVHGAGARVSAGQFKGRMSHHALNHAGRDAGGIGQGRALTTKRMEVKEQVRRHRGRGCQRRPGRRGASSLPSPRAAGRRSHLGGSVARNGARSSAMSSGKGSVAVWPFFV